MYDGGHKKPDWRIVAVASAGAFVAFLDTTVVNIAFPDIATSFPTATRSELSWVLDAYFVVIAACLIPAGGLAARIGTARLFALGTLAFGLTSALCAIAPSWQLLVAFRVLQGVAAAVIAPVSLALVLNAFPPERRNTGVGIAGAAAALAAAIGPTAGGAVVEGSDWRWIFALNIPLCAGILVTGRRVLPADGPVTKLLPDLLGAVLVALALGLLALGIVEGPTWGWTDARTLGCLLAATALAAVLARRIVRVERPIVPPELFTFPSVRQGNLGTLFFAMAFFSTILGNVLFLTGVWRYGLLQAGAATLPGPVLTTLAAGPAGRLADRFGHRAVVVPGTLFFAAGLLVLRSAGPHRDWLALWLPGSALNGIGIGLAFPTIGSAAVAAVPEEVFALASALNAACRQIGAALGTAILIAIVGQPVTLIQALDRSNNAYTFGVVTSLVAGAVALTLRPAPRAPQVSVRTAAATVGSAAIP